MKLKLKIFVAGHSIELQTNGVADVKQQVIRKVFERELKYARNKTDAVLNTAVLLDVDERTVWRVIDEHGKNSRG